MAHVIGAQLHLEALDCAAEGAGHDTGIIDQDVDFRAGSQQSRGCRTHLVQVGQVEQCRLQLSRQVLRAQGIQRRIKPAAVTRQQVHGGTCPGERARCFYTQASGGPRHQSHTPG